MGFEFLFTDNPSHLLHKVHKFNTTYPIAIYSDAISRFDFLEGNPDILSEIAQPMGCNMKRILLSKQIFIISMIGTLFATSAEAGGFEGKTMRDPFSNRSVERGLVLGKGWFQITAGNSYKNATGYWDDQGVQQDFESANWLYTTQYLGIRYGLTRNFEFSWKVRSHYVALTNSELGTDTSMFGLGDPELGVTYQLYRSSTPMTSIVTYAKYKAPFANEMPGNYVGGPNSFSNFVLTTGTPDVNIGLAAKKQFGPAAVTVDMHHVKRFSALASYAIETDMNQFSTRVKPGDLNVLDLQGEMQFGPLNVQAGGTYTQRGYFKIGSTSAGWLPNKNLENIDQSNGWAMDARVGATLNLLQEMDIQANAQIPLRGEDLMFFPLEDVHPTYGLVYSGELVYRF